MLRPLPDIDNVQVMTKLGHLSALRSARLDALHALRDSVVRMQSDAADQATEIAVSRACLDRLEEIDGIQGCVT